MMLEVFAERAGRSNFVPRECVQYTVRRTSLCQLGLVAHGGTANIRHKIYFVTVRPLGPRWVCHMLLSNDY